MAVVSVHIVTYNSAATIETCLRSILEQCYADFRVVVFDNASTDDTIRRIEKLRVDVVANEKNIGYAAAHNQAINATNSRYVLTLNPDVRLDPYYLYSMTCALDQNPEIGASAGCLLRVEDLTLSPTCIDSAGLFMRPNRRQGLLCEGLPISQRPMTQYLIFGPDGAAAFYRRAMLDDIRVMGEVFDQDFFMHKEDVDVCWRAQLRGWKSLYVPDAIAHHIRTFRPGQRQRVSAEMRFYGVRNRYLLMLKNEIFPHYLHDLYRIGLYDAGVLGYIALKEPASWQALWSVKNLFNRMMEKRKVIQAQRRVSWKDIRPWFDPLGKRHAS